jgi:hypothetical protein
VIRETIHTVAARGHLLLGGGFTKGSGYRPDRLVTRATQLDSRELFASSPVQRDVTLAPLRGPTLDQGQTGSCTGHGTAQAIYIAHAAAGKPIPFFPSPRVAYGIVRVLELARSGDVLTDIGAMPSDLITVVNKWGIAPIGFDSQCPTPDGRESDIWSSADVQGGQRENVNDKPSLLDLETAGLRLDTKVARVDEGTVDFGAQIQTLLENKCSLGVGIFVDTTNFMGWNPAKGPITQINVNDPQGGGHWLDLDYTYYSKGVQIVGGINSWSAEWPTIFGMSTSSLWLPGGWEMTLDCLKTVISDCLAYQAV